MLCCDLEKDNLHPIALVNTQEVLAASQHDWDAQPQDKQANEIRLC